MLQLSNPVLSSQPRKTALQQYITHQNTKGEVVDRTRVDRFIYKLHFGLLVKNGVIEVVMEGE